MYKNTWWRRNKPIIITLAVMYPFAAYGYSDRFGWKSYFLTLIPIAVSAAILLGVDAVVYRNRE